VLDSKSSPQLVVEIYLEGNTFPIINLFHLKKKLSRAPISTFTLLKVISEVSFPLLETVN
jgi:hypothetical protein